MTPTIWFIAEDETDAQVIRVLLERKRLSARVAPLQPSRKVGGINRLATELKRLIESAQKCKAEGDCIVVFHDADEFVQPVRETYERIRRICENYQGEVILLIAHDEIEAWLLADQGLCQWLGIGPRNCDEETKPSERLQRELQKRKGIRYQARYRDQVLNHVDGTGDRHSPSMQQAIQSLKTAPCALVEAT